MLQEHIYMTWIDWLIVLIPLVFVLSVGTIFIQRNWVELVYPFPQKMGWQEPVGDFLATVSKSFHPYIVWKISPVKSPINSYEFYFLIMVIALILYCVVSKLTLKEPFNLDRILHRGIYNDDDKVESKFDWPPRHILSSIISITPEYTRGDRLIAWRFFIYSFVYTFLIAFVGVVVWNCLSP